MTNCNDQDGKTPFVNFVNDAVVAGPQTPSFPAAQLFGASRPRIMRQGVNCADDSVLVWLGEFGELPLSMSFDEKFVLQSDFLWRISKTASSKGIESDGRCFASS